MKNTMMMAGALGLTLLGTGCATKKYVAQTVSPVEARVTTAEAKNTDQDKLIADNDKQIDEVNTTVSKTNEKLADTDAKAVAAGQAAQQAGQKADGAQKAAEDAKTFAQTGLEKADARANQLEQNIVAATTLKKSNETTVLFGLGSARLTDEGKGQLDAFAATVQGKARFVVEIQGFTDRTGSAATNERLSQARAQTVARYLINEHKIPVRSITMLGSGYALPVADDSTTEGRKQNRRVEIRLFVPELGSGNAAVATR